MTMVLFYSAVIYLSTGIYRTLEIGPYEQSNRGLNLEDRQFFSITTERWQFLISCEYI